MDKPKNNSEISKEAIAAIEKAVKEETESAVARILEQTQRNKLLTQYLVSRQQSQTTLRGELQHMEMRLSAYQAHLDERRGVTPRLKKNNESLRKCVQLLEEKLQSVKLGHNQEKKKLDHVVKKYQDVFAQHYAEYESIPEFKQMSGHRRQLYQAEHQLLVKEIQLKECQDTLRHVNFCQEHNFAKPNSIYVEIARLKLDTAAKRETVGECIAARQQLTEVPTIPEQPVPMDTTVVMANAENRNSESQSNFQQNISIEVDKEQQKANYVIRKPDIPTSPMQVPIQQQPQPPGTPKRPSMMSLFERVLMSPILKSPRGQSMDIEPPVADRSLDTVLHAEYAGPEPGPVPASASVAKFQQKRIAQESESPIPVLRTPPRAPTQPPSVQNQQSATLFARTWRVPSSSPAGSPFQLGFANVDSDFTVGVRNIEQAPATCNSTSTFKRPTTPPPRTFFKTALSTNKPPPTVTPVMASNAPVKKSLFDGKLAQGRSVPTGALAMMFGMGAEGGDSSANMDIDNDSSPEGGFRLNRAASDTFVGGSSVLFGLGSDAGQRGAGDKSSSVFMF